MLYRPKLTLTCNQNRLPIKLKNRHIGCQDFKEMRFSAEFERGFPVRFKTHFRLLEPIIGARPPARRETENRSRRRSACGQAVTSK